MEEIPYLAKVFAASTATTQGKTPVRASSVGIATAIFDTTSLHTFCLPLLRRLFDCPLQLAMGLLSLT